MAVRLEISFETLLGLVEQLTVEEQQTLLQHLSKRLEEYAPTNDQKRALLESAIQDDPVLEEPSPYREDWYDDDGR